MINKFNVNKAYSTLTSDVESDLATEHYIIDNLLKKKSQKGEEYRNTKAKTEIQKKNSNQNIY